MWKALGVDPEITPDHLTLGEIGLESMFAVELQQELEREYNMKININHIKTITVGLLKDYENGKTEYIGKYIDGMKRASEFLCSHQFTMPTKPYTKLNDVTEGRPIYFMPPFEITFSAYESFAKKFDRPVIGLNWTRDMNKLTTIKQINQYFTDLLKKLEPNGDYDLIGTLDGAIVVAKQLIKGSVRKGVIVDIINDDRYILDKVSDDIALEFILNFLAGEAPSKFYDKLKRGIFSEAETCGKIKRLSEEIKDFGGRSFVGTDFEEIMTIAVKRATIIWEYRRNKKLKFGNKLKETLGKKWANKRGKLHIIKAFPFDKVDDIEVKANTSRDLYVLPDAKVNN